MSDSLDPLRKERADAMGVPRDLMYGPGDPKKSAEFCAALERIAERAQASLARCVVGPAPKSLMMSEHPMWDARRHALQETLDALNVALAEDSLHTVYCRLVSLQHNVTSLRELLP